MTIVVGHGEPIFSPAAAAVADSQLSGFVRFCEREGGRELGDQAALERFAIDQPERFWRLLVDWSGLLCEGSPEPVLTGSDIERAAFLPNLRLSYAENLLRGDARFDDDRPALTACHASGARDRLTRGELRERVVRLAAALERLGVGPGERVVAIAHNNAEAVVAGLAATALGATFSAAAPDMGAFTVLSRFRQLEPSVLLASTNGQDEWASAAPPDRVAEVARELPSLRAFVALDEGPVPDRLGVPVQRLAELLEAGDAPSEPAWRRLPFNHPLFILFSSGTTGAPKCIVHGAGGTLLEHLKEHRLHCDLGPQDKLLFHTSAAWMMWNWQLSALACGTEIVLYDGPVTGPDVLWRLVAEEQVTVFGTSPPYLELCEQSGYSPRRELALRSLRTVLSTGSILYDRQYDWAREHVGELPLQSISGGSDIIGCFVLGSPNLPVYRGESQCRSLGLDVRALPPPEAPDAPIGELVCANPFPSRPLGFYGDADGSQFHAAYFSQNPGLWTHGDLFELTDSGGARLHGRSDGVLNVGGVRVGPVEIYRILDDVPEVREAMAIELPAPDDAGGSRVVLLVVPSAPGALDDAVELRIRRELASRGSPAHVPAVIVAVDDLPTTHSGKRSGQAARDVLSGIEPANVDALRNPECLESIARAFALATERRTPEPAAAGDDDGLADGPLQAIWAEVLGTGSIGPDDNFFDLGGTSLLAIRLFAAIHERTGIDLNAAILFYAPTLRAMAEVLRDGAAGQLSPLVLLRPGEGLPVFLVPGIYGDVFDVRALALMLRTPRPLYGLARGLDHAPAHERIEDMAEQAIDYIRARQPGGPYALVGFSFGGLVAFETARRLRAEGERVDLLGLIDTDVHWRCLSAPRRAWFKASWRPRRLRELVSSPHDELLPFAQRRGSRVVPWVPQPALPEEEQLPSRRELAGAAWEAFDAYRPGTYDGGATLFRATRRRARFCDPLPVWRRSVRGGLTVHPVAAAHTQLVLYPYARELADALDARL